MALSRRDVLPMIRRALAEDRARHDATSRSIIPVSQRIQARIIAKSPGIAAGVKMAMLTFTALDPSLRCRQHVRSGAPVRPGQAIVTIQGRARSIFAAERVALNFLMHLSGIATLTRAFADRAHGTRAKIFDTRKTLPGLRDLQKYAVRSGGGHNHRHDLAEAILIKTNHLCVAGSVQRIADREVIKQSIARARKKAPQHLVEIEVVNLRQFRWALEARPDAILLDNWTIPQVRQAVSYLNATRSTLSARPLLEVSGGVTLENVRAIAKTGVDRISIGRLTHSAPSLDVALRVI